MLRWTCACATGLLLASGWAPSEAGEGGKPQKRVWSGSRGRLGVSLTDVQNADLERLRLKEETGARVSDVTDESPAAQAGLKEDDVILRYEGETVRSASQLARLVRETPPGRKVQLEISRDGAVQQVTATLGEARGLAMAEFGNLAELDKLADLLPPHPPDVPEVPDFPNAPNVPDFQWRGQLDDDVRDAVRQATRSRGPRLGIRYHELSDQLASYFKVEDGVLVSSVDEESPAAKAGVKAGDVIVKLNGRKVGDPSDLGREVARLEPGVEATLTVQRDGHPVDLKVTVAGARPRRVPRGPTT